MSDHVRVHFQLTPDEDGYPPVGVETLWVETSANATEYVIDSIPFFVRDATVGDTIAVREEEGQRWFDSVVAESSNSLIRVMVYDRSRVPAVREQLRALGCETEYNGHHNLIAVNVPSTTSLARVQEFLAQEATADRVGYEEPILRQD